MKKLYITKAEWIDNFNIQLSFNDGVIKKVNFENFIKNHPHPAINRYKDIRLFKQFYLDDGNIVWDDNWNLIFPIINLYNNDLTTNFDK